MYICTHLLSVLCSLYPYYCSLQVTSDKLTEHKTVIPKAGPKFRIGMYFDTIHEIPAFDEIRDPEDGYPSCWETDTDFDDETGSLMFANINGDSASVICLDDKEVSQLLENWRNGHQGNSLTKDKPSHNEAQQINNIGSDGTYENEISPEDHIYETIDDCVDGYKLYLTASGDSNDSPTHSPPPTTANVVFSCSQVKKASDNKPKRSHTVPPPPESPAKYTRKHSDCTEYAHLHHDRRHSDPVSLTKKNQLYQEPSVKNNKTKAPLYSSLAKVNGKNKKETHSPAHIILKHKGKSYVLPLADTKKSDKSRKTPMQSKDSGNQQSSPKHAQHTMRQSPTTGGLASHGNGPVPRSQSMGFSQLTCTAAAAPPPLPPSSPPQLKTQANTHKQDSSHKRSKSRSHQQSTTVQQTPQPTPQVTHYGVI